MPRKKKAAVAPEISGGPSPEDEALMDPRPEHGAVHPDHLADGDPGESDPNLIDNQEDEEDEETPRPTTLERLQQQVIDMQRTHGEQIESLRRQIPPDKRPAATPPSNTPEEDPEDAEMENLLFSNPKEAAKRIRTKAVAQAKAEMTAMYQRDQNTQKFWTNFDKKYPDLAGDRDLVELTMNANLPILVNIPVEDAMKKVAELTRDRISRYTQGRPRPKRAFAEGAQPPAARQPAAQETKIPSLSDIVRARRAVRLSKKATAA